MDNVLAVFFAVCVQAACKHHAQGKAPELLLLCFIYSRDQFECSLERHPQIWVVKEEWRPFGRGGDEPPNPAPIVWVGGHILPKITAVGHAPIVRDRCPEGHVGQRHKAKHVLVLLFEASEVGGTVLRMHLLFEQNNIALVDPTSAGHPAPQAVEHAKLALLVDNGKVGAMSGFRFEGGL
jgi:hypothetical protein